MKRLIDISTWTGRAFLLASIIVLPFFRFLLQNRYNPITPESAAAAACLVLFSAAAAFIVRGKAAFMATAVVFTLFVATLPSVRLLEPIVRLSPAAAALVVTALLALAIRMMKEKFVPVALAFVWSAFAADIGHYLWILRAPKEAPLHQVRFHSRPPRHVIYLIVDEHIGLSGLPESIPECMCAGSAIQGVLGRNGFRVYPNAYSNYPSTVSSIPSLLNRKLLDKRGMFIDESSPDWQWGIHSFRENVLLDQFRRKDFRVHIYQHKAISFAPAVNAGYELHQYSDMLGDLRQAPGPWLPRFQWIVGNYQQSDHVLQRVKGFFPFRFAPHTTGPLALGSGWNRDLLADIIDEPDQALFFAHLMSPHFPYLYRRDGTVRDLQEWTSDRVDQRSNDAMYHDRYRRYCEQAQFLAEQLDRLFVGLQRRGLYDSSLVIVHGDHGSRIRRVLKGPSGSAVPTGSDPEAFDYAGAPPVRDLVDRFSALLAIKYPGARKATIDTRKGSLLRFLSETLPVDGQSAPDSASDAVYLFGGDGRPRIIRILDLWK